MEVDNILRLKHFLTFVVPEPVAAEYFLRRYCRWRMISIVYFVPCKMDNVFWRYIIQPCWSVCGHGRSSGVCSLAKSHLRLKNASQPSMHVIEYSNDWLAQKNVNKCGNLPICRLLLLRVRIKIQLSTSEYLVKSRVHLRNTWNICHRVLNHIQEINQ